MGEKLPDTKSLIKAVVITFALFGLVLLLTPKTSPNEQIELKELMFIQGSALKASVIPSDWKPYILAFIKECESGGNPTICNEEFGCIGGQGLYMITPNTLKDCKKVLGRNLDPFNPEDNEACAIWLYETRGTQPWGTAETWWGSYSCWSKEI